MDIKQAKALVRAFDTFYYRAFWGRLKRAFAPGAPWVPGLLAKLKSFADDKAARRWIVSGATDEELDRMRSAMIRASMQLDHWIEEGEWSALERVRLRIGKQGMRDALIVAVEICEPQADAPC